MTITVPNIFANRTSAQLSELDENFVYITTQLVSPTDDSTSNSSYFPIMSDTSSTIISSTKLYYNPSSGTLNATIFNSLSDINLKTDINYIANSTSILNNIDGVEFKWKDNDNKSYGVIAQQLENILPELVYEEKGIKSVNYSGLIAFLINAVKELDARIKELENKDECSN